MAKRLVGALDGKGHGCVIEQELPALKRGFVRVQVQASVISPGTELNGAKKQRKDGGDSGKAPMPFGYQNAGYVLECGENVKGFKPGDRVFCMGAGYAQHATIADTPQNLCFHLPENLGFEQAAYAHLVATGMNAIRRAQPELGEYFVVVGQGLVGQLSARLAQLSGCYVMGWDFTKGRLEIAEKWGIDGTTQIGVENFEEKARAFTNGYGFDGAVGAFGEEGTEAIKNIKKVMKTTPDTHAIGRLALVGGFQAVCNWGAGLGNLDLRCCARTGAGYHDEAWEAGETAYPPVFMRWTTQTNVELCLRLMAEKKVDVDALTTHVLPLAKIDEGVNALIDDPGHALGVILKMC